jgi:hypothetical protein
MDNEGGWGSIYQERQVVVEAEVASIKRYGF